MSEHGDERDPETGSFDADEWFRTQFGGQPAVEPPVAPPAIVPPPRPPTVEPVVTQRTPMVELEPTQPADIVPATAPLGDAATELMRQPEEGGALDELFGNDSFQEYDDTLISAVPRSTRRGSGGGDGSDDTNGVGEKAPIGRTQKVLLWVAGSLVAVLALIAIFFVGTRIPLLLGPAPGAIPSPTATPSPSAIEGVRPVGPVAPGEYRWDEIWGGECIEPFVDAWQDQVTVVDCATPHGGQLVLRAPFPTPEGTIEPLPYPGEEALAAQMSLLCSAKGVLDLTVAGAITDMQVQGAFPVSLEQWDAGERDYFCFVSRSSGEPLTGSLAIPTPAA